MVAFPGHATEYPVGGAENFAPEEPVADAKNRVWDEARQCEDGASPKGEVRWVPSGKRAEQFLGHPPDFTR